MPESPKRIVLEKSRTVRRRYQRSNKLFKFTPSQIARIEREEERERRAQKLREKEKKRIANKKKKEEKEAKERDERRRQGLPDPNAPTVPSSQPLLFSFLRKGPQPAANPKSPDDEPTSPSADDVSTGGDDSDASVQDGCSSDDTVGPDNVGEKVIEQDVLTGPDDVNQGLGTEKDDDEFSDCSIFYDEDIFKEADTIATALNKGNEQSASNSPKNRRSTTGLLRAESFRDETADLMEEFAHELIDIDCFLRDSTRRNAG